VIPSRKAQGEGRDMCTCHAFVSSFIEMDGRPVTGRLRNLGQFLVLLILHWNDSGVSLLRSITLVSL